MAQYIKNANIFGRIGSGIGQGLAEQVPKEIERGRLASGLRSLEGKKDLSPFQQFAELSAIPGITPQMVQSGSELLRQQSMLHGAQSSIPKNQQQFDEIKKSIQDIRQEPVKGLVGTEKTQAALQPAIPRSLQELQARAVELNQQSPGLYPDYQSALQGATLEDQQRISQNLAQREGRQSQKNVESDIRKELRGLQSAAQAQVPDSVYQKIENKALDAIERGEKDELTAAKDARDELDAVSRDYKTIDSFGDMTLIAGNPKEILSSINSLRKKFKANNDLENFADSLVSRNGLSNEFAHALAMPPREKISKVIKDLPALKGKSEVSAGSRGLIGYSGVNKQEKIKKTQDLINKITPLLDKDDSPLSIGNALSEKGYDSQIWRDYLIEHQNELNLSLSQIRELEKVDKAGQGFLNDWFLKIFGGF